MRREPPSAARWMLEHLTPRDRDEALAGDLLEAFQAGRSERWYWRQAVGAWAAEWGSHLRVRAPLLVFALLWSMLAPAWTTVLDRMENQSPLMSATIRMDWPLSPISQWLVWMICNVAFIWTGMLLYFVLNTNVMRNAGRRRMFKALALVVPLFLPLYFLTFLGMNFLASSGPSVDRRTLTVLHELIDTRTWSVVLRVPYFLTIVCALWGMMGRVRGMRRSALLVESAGGASYESSTADAAADWKERLDPFITKRFFAFVVTAGLLNALIAGYLVCRLPDAHAPTLSALLLRGALYVALGAVAGTIGAWIYWNNPVSPFRNAAPIPFETFALVCAAGWVWIPAMVIYAEQVAAASAIVALIGAVILAGGLRRITYFLFRTQPALPAGEPELFAETLSRAPGEPYGYVIALCIYAAGYELAIRSNMAAGMLLAAAAFVFVWQRTVVREDFQRPQVMRRRAALRFAAALAPAVVVTALALLNGVAHRNALLAAGGSMNPIAGGQGQNRNKDRESARDAGLGFAGYHSIILWPVPEKKEIESPVAAPSNLLAPGTTQPLTIHFDGEYWYFQPPAQEPSLRAHKTNATPLAVDIASSNSMPLKMEAHQMLGRAIPLARCRAIAVTIVNRDNTLGRVDVAVMLADSTSAKKQLMFVGQQPLASTEPQRFTVKQSGAREELRFAIPQSGPIRKFDEIMVLFLPDATRNRQGAKMAIEKFDLFPR